MHVDPHGMVPEPPTKPDGAFTASSVTIVSFGIVITKSSVNGNVGHHSRSTTAPAKIRANMGMHDR
jgi:hypothetical protein